MACEYEPDPLLVIEPLYCINKHERQRQRTLPAEKAHWAFSRSPNYQEVIEGDAKLLYGEYAHSYLLLNKGTGDIDPTKRKHLEEFPILADAGLQNAIRIMECDARVAKLDGLLTLISYNWEFQATRESWLVQMRWECGGNRPFESSHCGDMMGLIREAMTTEESLNETDKNWLRDWQEIILYHASLENDVFLGRQSWSYINACGNAKWVRPARYEVGECLNQFRFDHRLELDIGNVENELAAACDDLLAVIQDMSLKGQYRTKSCAQAIHALQTLTDYHMDVVFRRQLRQAKTFRVFTNKDLKALGEFESKQLDGVSHPETIHILCNWFKKLLDILHWNKICVGYAWCKIEFSTSMTLNKFIICHNSSTKEPIWMDERVKLNIASFLGGVARFDMEQQVIAKEKKRKNKGGQKHKKVVRNAGEPSTQDDQKHNGGTASTTEEISSSVSKGRGFYEDPATDVLGRYSHAKVSQGPSAHGAGQVVNRPGIEKLEIIVEKPLTKMKQQPQKKRSGKSKKLEALDSSYTNNVPDSQGEEKPPEYHKLYNHGKQLVDEITEHDRDHKVEQIDQRYEADEMSNIEQVGLRTSKNPFAMLDPDLRVRATSRVSTETEGKAIKGNPGSSSQWYKGEQQKPQKPVKQRGKQVASSSTEKSNTEKGTTARNTRETSKDANLTQLPHRQFAEQQIGRPQDQIKRKKKRAVNVVPREQLKVDAAVQKLQSGGGKRNELEDKLRPISDVGQRTAHGQVFEAAWPTILESAAPNIALTKTHEQDPHPEGENTSQTTTSLDSPAEAIRKCQEDATVEKNAAASVDVPNEFPLTERMALQSPADIERQDPLDMSSMIEGKPKKSGIAPDPERRELNGEQSAAKPKKRSQQSISVGTEATPVGGDQQPATGMGEVSGRKSAPGPNAPVVDSADPAIWNKAISHDLQNLQEQSVLSVKTPNYHAQQPGSATEMPIQQVESPPSPPVIVKPTVAEWEVLNRASRNANQDSFCKTLGESETRAGDEIITMSTSPRSLFQKIIDAGSIELEYNKKLTEANNRAFDEVASRKKIERVLVDVEQRFANVQEDRDRLALETQHLHQQIQASGVREAERNRDAVVFMEDLQAIISEAAGLRTLISRLIHGSAQERLAAEIEGHKAIPFTRLRHVGRGYESWYNEIDPYKTHEVSLHPPQRAPDPQSAMGTTLAPIPCSSFDRNTFLHQYPRERDFLWIPQALNTQDQLHPLEQGLASYPTPYYPINQGPVEAPAPIPSQPRPPPFPYPQPYMDELQNTTYLYPQGLLANSHQTIPQVHEPYYAAQYHQTVPELQQPLYSKSYSNQPSYSGHLPPHIPHPAQTIYAIPAGPEPSASNEILDLRSLNSIQHPRQEGGYLYPQALPYLPSGANMFLQQALVPQRGGSAVPPTKQPHSYSTKPPATNPSRPPLIQINTRPGSTNSHIFQNQAPHAPQNNLIQQEQLEAPGISPSSFIIMAPQPKENLIIQQSSHAGYSHNPAHSMAPVPAIPNTSDPNYNPSSFRRG